LNDKQEEISFFGKEDQQTVISYLWEYRRETRTRLIS